MAKYVRCANCGKKIHFGETICLANDEMSDAYCNADCYVNDYGGFITLDAQQANYWGFHVYDDDKRKKEIEEQMAKLQKELETLNNTK